MKQYIHKKILNQEKLIRMNNFLERTRKKFNNGIHISNDDLNNDKKERNSFVKWIPINSFPVWFSKELKQLAKKIYEEFGESKCPVGKNVKGVWTPRYEDVQYSHYPKGSHYSAWHLDALPQKVTNEDSRCISIVILLNDDFEGGSFEIKEDNVTKSINLKAGDMIAFPSKILEHRVGVCTLGCRKSLVIWISSR